MKSSGIVLNALSMRGRLRGAGTLNGEAHHLACRCAGKEHAQDRSLHGFFRQPIDDGLQVRFTPLWSTPIHLKRMGIALAICASWLNPKGFEQLAQFGAGSTLWLGCRKR
jgi:hypothetical protein